MSSSTASRIALAVVVVFLPIFAFSQLTIDARGPIRERRRNADAAQGGGAIVRNASLQVAVRAHKNTTEGDAKTEVEFVLTNSGKSDLAVPISPNPGDLEPADPKTDYAVEWLGLTITPVNKPSGMLAGGALLCGRQGVPGTLITLAPGGSIRVLTLVALPSAAEVEAGNGLFSASALLSHETLKNANGNLFSNLQTISSAHSPEFTLGSLFP